MEEQRPLDPGQGDCRELDAAPACAGPDHELVAADGPSFSREAGVRAAGVTDKRPVLVAAAEHLPARATDSVLCAHARELLDRLVPRNDRQVCVEGKERVSAAE